MVDLKQAREKSKQMLATFLNTIGLDGEYYSSLNNCPITWGKTKLNATGEFVTPYSQRMQQLLKSIKIDDKTKEIINSKGLIIVNQNYKQEYSPDLFVTIIHETIHSNRNLLIYDVQRDNSNEKAYTVENEIINQNTNNYSFTYADASQDILKGIIDNSQNTVKKYENKTTKELDNKEFKEGKIASQMEKQQLADEALVELMSILAYKIYSNTQKGINSDIWQIINEAREHYEGEDIGIICEIILKHEDLELFYWMIDPITYSMGDIHYDFFKEYTKNDQELLEQLYGSDSLDLDAYLFGDAITR